MIQFGRLAHGLVQLNHQRAQHQQAAEDSKNTVLRMDWSNSQNEVSDWDRIKNLVKLAPDLTRPKIPKWWYSKGNPLISGKPKLAKYYNLARNMFLWLFGGFFSGNEKLRQGLKPKKRFQPFHQLWKSKKNAAPKKFSAKMWPECQLPLTRVCMEVIVTILSKLVYFTYLRGSKQPN